MPRKNRGYKRGEPFKDSRLFVIACEGIKREKNYFYEIHKRSQRIRVKLLEPKEHEGQWKSAPKWLLDKAASFEEEFDLLEEDFLWFVMDVDNWDKQQIALLESACSARPNWHLAISNPCFEVWLFMHLKDIGESQSTKCKELKNELHIMTGGKGYNPEEFVSLIKTASSRARESDSKKDYYFPAQMETKVYLLTDKILEFAGKDL